MSEQLSIEELEMRLRPFAYSQAGFLGPNESLQQIISEDTQTLAELNITHQQLADRLESLLFQGLELNKNLIANLIDTHQDNFDDIVEKIEFWLDDIRIDQPERWPENPMKILPDESWGGIIEGKFQIFIQQWRGFQECPWDCEIDIRLFSIDFMLLNRRTGYFIMAPGMINHLIREHNFFEGKGTPYRVDPQKLVRVLDLNEAHLDKSLPVKDNSNDVQPTMNKGSSFFRKISDLFGGKS
ncbi:MAG: hypothetical protein AAF490_14410 [Chloroflexota bacterium]